MAHGTFMIFIKRHLNKIKPYSGWRQIISLHQSYPILRSLAKSELHFTNQPVIGCSENHMQINDVCFI